MALTELGFVRDTFTNNTRCHASQYHATSGCRDKLPEDKLWESVCDLLRQDRSFAGCLEEEAIDPKHRRKIAGSGSKIPEPPGPLQSTNCGPGRYKACDLHISIDLNASHDSAVAWLEHLELMYFDKPTPTGTRRVYTVTCETCEDGETLLNMFHDSFLKVPGLKGKMKLEITTRHFRHPEDAPTLPLTTGATIGRWKRGVAVQSEES